MARDDPMMRFRAPPELKQIIEDAAATNGRSLNAEILHRLEFSDENSQILRSFLEAELSELQHDMPHLIAARDEHKTRFQAAMDAVLSGTPIDGEVMAELRYELRMAQERLDEKAARMRRIERVLGE